MIMVAVALVAVSIFTAQMGHKRRAYLEEAEAWASSEKGLREAADRWLMQTKKSKNDNQYNQFCESQLKNFTGRADYNREMERKYRQAARFPWLYVEPDPPPPR